MRFPGRAGLPLHWTLASALTALACGVAAWAALHLAIPPGYASPLFPAAGIALAAVLTGGWRMAIGVAAGSFCATWLAPHAAGGLSPAHSALLAAALAAAAALQAIVGAALLHRLAPRPLTLAAPREIALFFLLVALAGLVAPTLGTLALIAGGPLGPADALATWATWWSGDALGAVIAAPVVLTLIGRPREEWQPRRLTVGVALTLGMALLAAMIVQVGRWDEQRTRAAFERDADGLARLAEARLQQALYAVKALHGLFAASDDVSHTELGRAAGAWLEYPTPLLAIGWGERLTRGAAGDFAGETLRVRYIEPLATRRTAIGADLLAQPAAREAVEAARRTGLPQASAGLALSPAPEDELGIQLFQAVYDGQPRTGAERMAATRGLVFVDVRPEDALRGLGAMHHRHDLRLCLVDMTQQGPQRLAGASGCNALRPQALQWRHVLPFAGRTWELRITPGPGQAASPGNTWLISLIGLAGAALLGALLLTITGRTRRIEFAVRERTAALEAQMHERTQAEAALRESEQRFRNILDNVPIGVVYTDVAGRIMQANPRFCEMTGYSAGQLAGMRAQELAHPDDVAQDEQLARQLLQGVVPMYRRQKRYVTRGGDLVWVQCVVSLLRDAQGRPRRIVGVVEDITEHLRLLEAERARESAEFANRAKSDFLSRMSHELRTPLNAMLGFAQLLELDQQQPLTEVQRPWVQQIQQAGWHLLEMINDVLDLSRIESGTLRLQVETLSLAEQVAACRALLAHEAEQRGIVVTQALADGTDALLGDATRVKQILTNLLSNAVKYNRDGGRIHIASRVSRPGTVEIAVTDTGLGMTPEQLQGLFRPFDRLGRERSVQQGTGIGLVISQRLAELMGGTLVARSTAGEGSSFILSLPGVIDPDTVASALDELDSHPPEYHRRRVHYVEDNETNVEVMRGILAQRPQVDLGVSITGLDGLRAIRAQRPDLILLDMHLPDISGLELLRHLKADAALAGVPVVAVSADALQSQVDAALAAGAQRYLTKPVSVAELLATVDGVLAQVDTDFL